MTRFVTFAFILALGGCAAGQTVDNACKENPAACGQGGNGGQGGSTGDKCAACNAEAVLEGGDCYCLAEDCPGQDACLAETCGTVCGQGGSGGSTNTTTGQGGSGGSTNTTTGNGGSGGNTNTTTTTDNGCDGYLFGPDAGNATWKVIKDGAVTDSGALVEGNEPFCWTPSAGSMLMVSYGPGASPCAGQTAQISVVSGPGAQATCPNALIGYPADGACVTGCVPFSTDQSFIDKSNLPYTAGDPVACSGQRGWYKVSCQ